MLPIFPSSNTDFIGSAHDAGGPYLPLAGGTMLGIIYGKGGTSSRLDLTELSGSKLQYGTLSLEVATNLSLNVSGVPKFAVDTSGNIQLTTTSKVLFSPIAVNGDYIGSDGTNIDIVQSNNIVARFPRSSAALLYKGLDVYDSTAAQNQSILIRQNSTGILSGLTPFVVDGASAVAYTLDTKNTLANATAKLFALRNNTSEKVTVLASGFVGIGTTTPVQKLQVDDGAIYAHNSSFYADNNFGLISIDSRNGFFADTTGLVFKTNVGNVATEIAKFSLGGNLGINTSFPVLKLDVGAGNGSYLNAFRVGFALIGGHSGTDYDSIGYNTRPTASGGVYNYIRPDWASRIQFYAGGFRFFTGGAIGATNDAITETQRIGVLQTGEVGIGITQPTASLHINTGSAIGDATGVKLKVNNAWNDWSMEVTGAGAIFQSSGGSLKNILAPSGNSYITAGFLGIGTSSPTSTLQVVGDSNLGGFVVSNAGLVTAGTVPVARITGLGTMATAATTDYLPLTQSATPTSFVDLFGTTRGVIKKLDYTMTGAVTNTSNIGIAELFTLSATLGSGGGHNHYAKMSQVIVPLSNVETINAVYGEIAYVYHYGTGVVSNLIGKYVLSGQTANAGAVTTLLGLHVNTFSQSTAVVTSQISLQITGNRTGAGTTTDRRAININALNNSGTITDTYGIYIGSQTAGTQTNLPFSIYSFDANAKMYHAGNVGIGTTTPTTKLHIANTSGGNEIRLDAFNNTNALRFYDTNSTRYSVFQTDNSATTKLTIASDGNAASAAFKINVVSYADGASSIANRALFDIQLGGTSKVFVDNLGNVGIGITSPAAVLHINSTTAGAGIRISQNNSVNHYTRLRESGQDGFGGAFLDAYFDNNQVLAFSFDPALNKPSIIYGSRFANTSKNLTISIRGGADVMTFDNAGYIGIGTTSPAAKLQIDGGVSQDPVLFRVKNGTYAGSVRLEADPAGNSSVALTLTDYTGSNKYAIQVANSGYLECRSANNTLLFGASAAGFTISGFIISSAGVVTAGTVPVARLSGVVPTANLGTGTANATTYLRGDQTWQPVTGGNNLDAIYNAMMN